MPELPEVETVLRTLEKQLQHPQIKNARVYYDKVIATSDVETFISQVKEEQIIDYHRIGKYLIFECTNIYLIVHLRMEGKFYIQEKEEPLNKHIHVVFDLDNGKQLRYHDTRKFGRMYVYDKSIPYSMLEVFKNVGYDVFDENLDSMYLYKQSRNKSVTLKQFLLDQRYMAGVGNIYADEICFALSLHPKTKVSHLSKKDFEKLLFETRRILSEAIQEGGTTIRSYTSSLKVDGRFQLKLKVHNKKEELCSVCNTPIEKIFIGGRGTYFCRSCQKKK